MIKNLQVTILILIIILSGEFIVLNLIKNEKTPDIPAIQKSDSIFLAELTTATSTTSLLSPEELKRVIDNTTAPESKVNKNINK